MDAATAGDAQADAEALRPAVEFLENLGSDPEAPLPVEDPVPSDPTPLPDVPAEGPEQV